MFVTALRILIKTKYMNTEKYKYFYIIIPIVSYYRKMFFYIYPENVGSYHTNINETMIIFDNCKNKMRLNFLSIVIESEDNFATV